MVWSRIALPIVARTGYLSPPMAAAILSFRAISPPAIATTRLRRGVVPFIALRPAACAAVPAFPGTVPWLPKARPTPG
jgi:TRAP-type mannitol/chloroaromatic compound transport system permease large subunit